MPISTNIKNKFAFLFVSYNPLSSPLAIAKTEEFKELSRAGGLKFLNLFYQVVKKPSPATFIGSGKIQELKNQLLNSSHSLKDLILIFDSSLSGVQIRNLEKELEVKVMDRQQLILEIFAQRAKTYSGKLQVELARHLDELPRMVGAWMSSLSRQGGRIGTKGPGEKALEKDRRQVQQRISSIKKKLKKIHHVRKLNRSLRKKNKTPVLALIGYTNSGKSTLLNALTNSSSATTQHLPFMTLDPMTRKVYIKNTKGVLVTDTVGFIYNLSPHLISAFKATLEESETADILLHVIDLSSPLMKLQMETVNNLITEFGWQNKPCIHIYNKIDVAPKAKVFHINAPSKAFVSAIKRTGLDNLKKTIAEVIAQTQTEMAQLYFPKNQEEQIYALDRKAFIYKKEVSSLGTLCYVKIRPDQLSEWKDFMVQKATIQKI